ncbi:MAG: hypothetical protein N3J91_16600 [Verrucomicrobiae bacterium]|nr:hypothetical protein [Verrucomicrobiae bacterium]
MKPVSLVSRTQLLVEGHDAQRFFQAFLNHCQRAHVQVQNFGGISELGPFLKALSLMPGFRSTVTTVAVIRDAEASAQAAWQSAASSLKSAGLTAPPSPACFSTSTPRTGIFILPDNQSAGTLETLCLQSVQTDPALPCVGQFMQCVAQAGFPLPASIGQADKRRVQAFLASRDKPGLRLGEAAEKGYWPFNQAAFAALRSFCQGL